MLSLPREPLVIEGHQGGRSGVGTRVELGPVQGVLQRPGRPAQILSPEETIRPFDGNPIRRITLVIEKRHDKIWLRYSEEEAYIRTLFNTSFPLDVQRVGIAAFQGITERQPNDQLKQLDQEPVEANFDRFEFGPSPPDQGRASPARR